jgi:hypothetical protein
MQTFVLSFALWFIGAIIHRPANMVSLSLSKSTTTFLPMGIRTVEGSWGQGCCQKKCHTPTHNTDYCHCRGTALFCYQPVGGVNLRRQVSWLRTHARSSLVQDHIKLELSDTYVIWVASCLSYDWCREPSFSKAFCMHDARI